MPAFLDGGGECGALIKSKDWSETLGPVEGWSQSLKATTGLLLRSPVPMVMLWGEDGIMLYNDAYSAFADKRHPELLGSKVREGWPEVADFNDRVMKVGLAGGTLSFRDQQLVLYRRGVAETVAMDLDYSPVLGDDGRPAGVLAIVIETTARIEAERRLLERNHRLTFFDTLSEAIKGQTSPTDIMGTTAKLLGEQMGASVVAYADMEADEDQFTIRGDWAAPGSTSIVGSYSLAAFGPTAVRHLKAGKGEGFGWLEAVHPDDRPEAERTFLRANDERQAFEIDMRVRRADGSYRWCIDTASPRFDGGGRFMGYVGSVFDVDERREALDKIRRSEEQLRALIEQMPIGVAVARMPGGEIFLYNQALENILGHPILSDDKDSYDRYGGIDEEGNPLPLEAYPLFRAIAFHETVVGNEMRYRRPDGRIINLLGHAAPIVSESEQADLAVVTLQDITDRKAAEAHQKLLINELSHRAKNLLAIIQSIAQQSFKGEAAASDSLNRFEGRLGALSAAHGILTKERWEAVPLRRLICDTYTAVRSDDSRLSVNGPNIDLPPKVAVSLAMAVHELATNAIKYGSLSNEEGEVLIHWTATDNRLRLTWEERGGPPVATPPRRGFGSRMIERGLAAELGGSVSIRFAPTGVVCEVDAPLPAHA